MINRYRFRILLFLIFLVIGYVGFGQGADKVISNIKLSAGPQYKRSLFYQWLWGRNYRKEWTTLVQFPVLYLDTLKAGIISYQEGGGHQSLSLHLTTVRDKEYALRSVDKFPAQVLPKIFHHTFIERLLNDLISTSHPYGALAVPLMAQSVNIYHTNPKYFYLPEQLSLDTFNKKYGNKLYLFEQKPAGDWSKADNLGNFGVFLSSDEMLEKIYQDNDHQVDQAAFARARLFDLFIGDWDRHADQWKWGVVNKGHRKLYEPVPTDRDQAFFKHNGLLLNLAIFFSGLKFLQSFDYTIHNVKGYSYGKRLLDRLLTNQLTLVEWQAIAKIMAQSLTGDIIVSSVKQMPPEIFTISGNEIIAKLKSRRKHLVEYATKYYLFIAKQVTIEGSKGDEYFEINRLNDDETAVHLYKLNKERKKEDTAFYSRIFKTNETKEIRLYGLSGNDIYRIDGKVDKGINIRIIGGTDRDSIINSSKVSGRNKIHIYDNADNYFQKDSNIKFHLIKDTNLHKYDYYIF